MWYFETFECTGQINCWKISSISEFRPRRVFDNGKWNGRSFVHLEVWFLSCDQIAAQECSQISRSGHSRQCDRQQCLGGSLITKRYSSWCVCYMQRTCGMLRISKKYLSTIFKQFTVFETIDGSKKRRQHYNIENVLFEKFKIRQDLDFR